MADIGDAAGIERVLWAPVLMSLLPPMALFALTRLQFAGRASPEENTLDTRVSLAPSSEIASESAPVVNPLHKASAQSTSFEMVELVELGLVDHIPEPTELHS